MLSLSLFGWPQLKSDDQPVVVETRKALALLAFLAATGGQHSREKLAALFWPEYDPKRARANLRRVLWSVMQALGPEGLVVDQEKVSLDSSTRLRVDVIEFLERTDGLQKPGRAGEPADGRLDEALTKCTQAIELYRDEFMAGFHLDDAPEFERWQQQQSQFLFQRLVVTFERLVDGLARRGDYQLSLHYAQRWLALDELNEDVHRRLMRLYAWQDNRPAALQQYHDCVTMLADALNVAPTQATVDLYESIRRGQLASPAPRPVDRAPTGKPIPPNPYRGLRAFREEDSAIFHGRESLTQALIAAVHQQPVVTLFGSSGSGKSSLIQAGLLASLRPDNRWLIIQFRPGSRPFHALAAALNNAVPETGDSIPAQVSGSILADRLNSDPLALVDRLSQIAAAAGQRTADFAQNGRILLVADQFEELFTLCADPDLRYRFVERLLSPFRNPPAGPHVAGTLLLGMRADFLGHALKFRPLADALQHHDLMLGPMSPEELRRAIRQPAHDSGVEFEAGLINRLLDDVGDEPGNLPLLQFALTTLWQGQQGGLLTHAAYEAAARVQGALAAYADNVLAAFDAGDETAARRLFVQLVQPGEGTEDTRRVAARSELGETNWQLAQRLADARLVVTGRNAVGDEVVELAHEALIHGWPRLREWMAADRRFRLWQERLRGLARQWEHINRDPGMFLRGFPLAEAQAWLAQRPDEIGPAEQEFIQASLRQQEEQELAAAKTARSQARQRRWIRLGAVAGVVGVAALAGAAVWQWQQAQAGEQAALSAQQQVSLQQEQQSAILSRQLALHSQSLPPEQVQLATLLSLEAVNQADTFEARQSLFGLFNAQPHLKTIERGYDGAITAVAFSLDDRMILSGDTGGGLYFWNVEAGEKTVLDVSDSLGRVIAMAAHPREPQLAVGGENGVIQLWDTAQQQRLSQSFAGHSGDILDLEISADGRYLASLAGDQRLLLWDLQTGDLAAEPILPPDPTLREFALSPDGRWLATGGGQGALQLRSLPAGQIVWPSFLAHEGEVTSLAFSPDGQVLASGGADGLIRLWQAATGEAIDQPFPGQAGAVRQILFSPDGRYLVSSGQSSVVHLWQLDKKQPVSEALYGPEGIVISLAFSSDGRWLTAGSTDGTTLVWDTSTHPLQADVFTRSGDTFKGVSLHPDGRWLAVGTQAGEVILWDMDSHISQTLTAPGLQAIQALAFSKDGLTLTVVDQQYDVAAWEVDTLNWLYPPAQVPGLLYGPVQFAPDGQTILLTPDETRLTIWNSRSNELLANVDTRLSLSYANVALSPDGRFLAVPDCQDEIVEWRVYYCRENNVLLWDVIEGRWLGREFPGDLNLILAMAFSPDGAYLAATKIDGSLVTWEVATGREVSRSILTANNIYMRAAQFSPDGSLLVASLETGEVLLWDVQAQQAIGRLPAHLASPQFALSADGQLLAALGPQGQVTLWDIGLLKWKQRACERINRSLTLDEWAQYLGDLPHRETC